MVAAVRRLPLPLLHECHRIQPHGHPATAHMGEDGHDVRGGDIAGHRYSCDRPGGECAARMTPHPEPVCCGAAKARALAHSRAAWQPPVATTLQVLVATSYATAVSPLPRPE